MALTTYTWIFQDILDNREQFATDSDRAIHEMTESLVPIYSDEVISEWREMPSEHSDYWQEVGVDENATIISLMATDLYYYYDGLVSRAWAEVEETHTCDTPAPESVTVSPSGTMATCHECDFKSALWECACELVHDCEVN